MADIISIKDFTDSYYISSGLKDEYDLISKKKGIIKINEYKKEKFVLQGIHHIYLNELLLGNPFDEKENHYNLENSSSLIVFINKQIESENNYNFLLPNKKGFNITFKIINKIPINKSITLKLNDKDELENNIMIFNNKSNNIIKLLKNSRNYDKIKKKKKYS